MSSTLDGVINIEDLRKEADDQMFMVAQQNLIQTLKKENDILREKVNHLEMLLKSKSSLLTIRVSDEEQICIEQIETLKSASSNRELSLDEVKRLDLLIKNLRLARQQSTQVIESVDYTVMKESDLVAALNPPTPTNR